MTTGADWLDTARRALESFLTPPEPPADTGSAGTAGAAHADTCRWCPICQAVAVARGERPEVSAALADLLTTSAAALRSFAESVPTPEQADHRAGYQADHQAGPDVADLPADDDPAAPPARTVQRIDIG